MVNINSLTITNGMAPLGVGGRERERELEKREHMSWIERHKLLPIIHLVLKYVYSQLAS